MIDAVRELLKAHLKQLRLPAMVQELEALSREAAATDQDYEHFLLRLTEVELAARASNALQSRIKQADFPVSSLLSAHLVRDFFEFRWVRWFRSHRRLTFPAVAAPFAEALSNPS